MSPLDTKSSVWQRAKRIVEIRAELTKFQDSRGYIVHKHGSVEDGGDTAQREGMVRIAESILRVSILDTDPQTQCEGLLFSGPEPVRNPDPTKWWGQPGTMSRDNTFPLIVAMGLLGLQHQVYRLMFMLIKRAGWFWNTKHIWPSPNDPVKLPDLIGPMTVAALIRAGLLWPLYPLLVAIDLWAILAVAVRITVAVYKPGDTSDDLNLTAYLLQAKKVFPTPFSFLARKLYRGRPAAAPDEAPLEKYEGFGPVTAFKEYFRPELGAPPIDKLYELFLEKEL